MALFPSEEWLKLYVECINASPEYREAAATWEGDVCLVFEADPGRGVAETIHAWLDLHRGECRSGRMVGAEEGERSAYLISAPYARWKEVLRGELDPVKGMMQGKLKLRGDLPSIVRHVKAANILVNLSGKVPTEFIDE